MNKFCKAKYAHIFLTSKFFYFIMKYNAFLNSLKVQTHNFRSEVIKTSNEFSFLELKYKELQKNLVPVFRSFSLEKDAIEIAERKNRRENDRARINNRPKSQRIPIQNSNDLQHSQTRPKSELIRTREFNSNEIGQQYDMNQSFSPHNNDRRRVIPAPCHVMTFEKERYSPFNARANSTQIRIKKSFPPPKGLAEAAEKRKAMKDKQESTMKVRLPRVAYLKATTPS